MQTTPSPNNHPTHQHQYAKRVYKHTAYPKTKHTNMNSGAVGPGFKSRRARQGMTLTLIPTVLFLLTMHTIMNHRAYWHCVTVPVCMW